MKMKIPKFKNEDEERLFWATHDSTEFIDWKKAKRTLLPNLKPSVKTISLRLPEAMLEELKLLASKQPPSTLGGIEQSKHDTSRRPHFNSPPL